MERMDRKERVVMVKEVDRNSLSFDLAYICGMIKEALGGRGFTVIEGREIVIRQTGRKIVVVSQNADEPNNSSAIDFNATG